MTMRTLHRGHIFHLTGRPTVQEAAAALVSEYRRRGLRGVIGRGIQTVGPDAAKPRLNPVFSAEQVLSSGEAPCFIAKHP